MTGSNNLAVSGEEVGLANPGDGASANESMPPELDPSSSLTEFDKRYLRRARKWNEKHPDKPRWIPRRLQRPVPPQRLRPITPFPQFTRLPFELRQLIWESYCPQLLAKSRLLSFSIDDPQGPMTDAKDEQDIFVLNVTNELKGQTQELRTVLSVHKESRDLAKKLVPDTLTITPLRTTADYTKPLIPVGVSQARIRFNKERDIVHLGNMRYLRPSPFREFPMRQKLMGVEGDIRNVAIDIESDTSEEPEPEGIQCFTDFLTQFPNLKTIYYTQYILSGKVSGFFREDLSWITLPWCHSWLSKPPSTDKHHLPVKLYFWPDATRMSDYAFSENLRGFPEELELFDYWEDWTVVPMLCFRGLENSIQHAINNYWLGNPSGVNLHAIDCNDPDFQSLN